MCDELGACQEDSSMCDESDYIDENDPYPWGAGSDLEPRISLEGRGVKPTRYLDLSKWALAAEEGRKLTVRLVPAAYHSTTAQLNWALRNKVQPLAFQ